MHINPPSKIAFLGIGLMGEPMARNLLNAGFGVKIWNRTASKTAALVAAGTELASAPADTVRDADAVLLMLENGAAKGTLAIMAGGSAADIVSAAPLFRALGTVTHVGPQGRGQLCKLVNQAIAAVTIGAVAEGLILARAGGADPAQVRKAILGGFCQSRILEEH